MRVDQSRQDGCIGQIDAHGVARNLRFRAGANTDDAPVFDDQRLIAQQFAGLHVEHMPGMNRHVPRGLSEPDGSERKNYNRNRANIPDAHDLLSPDKLKIVDDSGFARMTCFRRPSRPQTRPASAAKKMMNSSNRGR